MIPVIRVVGHGGVDENVRINKQKYIKKHNVWITLDVAVDVLHIYIYTLAVRLGKPKIICSIRVTRTSRKQWSTRGAR